MPVSEELMRIVQAITVAPRDRYTQTARQSLYQGMRDNRDE